MTVLGIETATALCGAALARDGAIVAASELTAPQMHSERLLSLVDEVLGSAGCALGQLDAVACSIGPGSFTGLRIGLSVAKGLAYAADLPIVAVPTLEALAFRAAADGRAGASDAILAAIDARRDEVYAALYGWSGAALELRLPQRAWGVRALLEALGGAGRVVLVGDGSAKVHLQAAASGAAARYLMPPPGQESCSAGCVARLGAERLRAGGPSDLESLEPEYVKDFHTTATPISQQG